MRISPYTYTCSERCRMLMWQTQFNACLTSQVNERARKRETGRKERRRKHDVEYLNGLVTCYARTRYVTTSTCARMTKATFE